MPGHFAGRVDQLLDADANARADVVAAKLPFTLGFDRNAVNIGQVFNVHVVSNARPVRSRIVQSEYLDVAPVEPEFTLYRFRESFKK